MMPRSTIAESGLVVNTLHPTQQQTHKPKVRLANRNALQAVLLTGDKQVAYNKY